MIEFQELHSDLFLIDDPLDKYDWIMEYGAIAKTVPPPVQLLPKNLVQGCTSNLWLECRKNKYYCYADSLIVQGIASMICDYYNQASVEKREEFSLSTLTAIGLAPLLSMGRQNGVANLIKKIKSYE
jgi:sulfur transfer protein SufE